MLVAHGVNMKTRMLSALLLFMVSGIGQAQIDITSGLIAHYPLDGNADDASGNDNHGTVFGAVPTTDALGRENHAYEFNGLDSYISVPNSASISSPDTELTMIAWVNPYGWSQIGAAFGPILMKSDSGTNSFQYRMHISTEGVGASLNDWNNSASSGTNIRFNQWHAVAATFKADTIKLFYDGKLVHSAPILGPISLDELPLEIGRDMPGLVEYFYGKIDDIRIYNRELTPREVQFASGFIFVDSFETPE